MTIQYILENGVLTNQEYQVLINVTMDTIDRLTTEQKDDLRNLLSSVLLVNPLQAFNQEEYNKLNHTFNYLNNIQE